jgi:predicted nuclease of predicted toxin-antitoxin system
MTVQDVLEYLAGGMTEDEILTDFPDLTHEDIRACLAFAADRERRLAVLPQYEIAVWSESVVATTNQLADLYPGSLHIREAGLKEATDAAIWDYAGSNRFIIVTKDIDFQQRSLLYGHPPKVVRLRVGNCTVGLIQELLSTHSPLIHSFGGDEEKSYLVLP